MRAANTQFKYGSTPAQITHPQEARGHLCAPAQSYMLRGWLPGYPNCGEILIFAAEL